MSLSYTSQKNEDCQGQRCKYALLALQKIEMTSSQSSSCCPWNTLCSLTKKYESQLHELQVQFHFYVQRHQNLLLSQTKPLLIKVLLLGNLLKFAEVWTTDNFS